MTAGALAVAAAADRRRQAAGVLPLLVLALALAPALAAAAAPAPAPEPSKQQVQEFQQMNPTELSYLLLDTVSPGAANAYLINASSAPASADATVLVTVSIKGDSESGDVRLFCGRPVAVSSQTFRVTEEWESEALGVNKDVVSIPPPTPGELAYFGPSALRREYVCVVEHQGLSNAPITYTISRRFDLNATDLDAEEADAAEELFDRCCQAESSCLEWKSIRAQAAASNDSSAGDLCLVPGAVCEDGQLTALTAQRWGLACEPWDIFAHFKGLRGLYLRENSLTGDINEVARNLSTLPGLEELGLYLNDVTGQLGDDSALCALAQGPLEMLNVGGNDLRGSLPACLFNDNSSLYQFSALDANLTGTIPDAFAGADTLQLLELSGNNLTGTLPESLAALPSLLTFKATDNELTGAVPDFASDQLSQVSLAGNGFTSIAAGLAAHPSLEALDLSDNRLAALPEAWQKAPSGKNITAPLAFLMIQGNPTLKGSGFPLGLAAYPKLTSLRLDDDLLGGPLPNPSPGQFPALRDLIASNNSLTGTIGEGWNDTGILQLPPISPFQENWNIFAVDINQLTGLVPQFLYDANVNIAIAGNNLTEPQSAGSSDNSDSSLEGAVTPRGNVQSADGSGSSSDSSSGLSGGAIAGICIGVLAVVAAAVGIAVWHRGRARRMGGQATDSGRFRRFEDELEGGALQQPTTPGSPATFAPYRGVELSSSSSA